MARRERGGACGAQGSATITATSEGHSGTGTVTVTPPPPAGAGIWISRDEIMRLPTSGSAWNAVKSAADNIGPALGGHNSNHDVNTLAAALVAVRLNSATYYQRAADNLILAIGTETNCGGDTCNSLSLSRNLDSYVIAADVIDFKHYDPVREPLFRAWVNAMRTYDHPAGGGCSAGHCSITDKNDDRPNNHGAMAGASRVAASLYLGDMADVARAATVFKGYVGDRSAYVSFDYGELSWQCDAAAPVGINPKGCVKSGLSIDGVQPDDQRRCGSFSNPPCYTNYAWGALEGIIVQAFLLYRAGYDVFNWSDQAILRAYQWLLTGPGNSPASGDDMYQMPLLDRAYGTHFWNGSTVGNGKNMGWTDWTHQ